MTPERERLKIAIERRAIELRLRLNKVARRAGMSEANFFRIRNGEIALTDMAIATIEEALEWDPGSIQDVLNGAEPTTRQGTMPTTPAGVDPKEWASWSPEDREFVLAAVRAANARAARDRAERERHRPGSAA